MGGHYGKAKDRINSILNKRWVVNVEYNIEFLFAGHWQSGTFMKNHSFLCISPSHRLETI